LFVNQHVKNRDFANLAKSKQPADRFTKDRAKTLISLGA